MSNSAPSSDGDNGGGAPSRSASAIVAEAIAGSYDLKIKGYSVTKGLTNGRFIKSETFAVGGHRWCLRYYPNGCCSSDAGWLSFILFLDENDASEVTAQYKVSMLDHNGELVPSYAIGTRNTFSKEVAPRDSHRLIAQSALEKLVYLKDDVFSVRCDLTVLSILAMAANSD
jgi:speckle-type POZ protein